MIFGKNAEELRGQRWRRFVSALLLLAAFAALAPYAWRQWQFLSCLKAARYALAQFAAENARTELADAQVIRPDSPEVEYLLGVANRKAGNIGDVRAHLERAMQLGWPKKDVRFQLTLLAFQSGDRNAEYDLRQSILRPMDDDIAEQIYESLALGYLAEYRVSDAMTVLAYWTEWRPDRIRPRLLRAEVYDLTNQRRQQEEEYRKALETDPDSYAAHLGLGHVLQSNRDSEQALTHFRYCHQVWRDDPVAGLGVAACLQELGKLAEAKQVLSEMRTQKLLPHPQRAVALSELGEMAEQDRDLEAAIKLLSEAAELDPYNPRWHYQLGICLAKTGHKEEAKRHTQRSQELDRLHERRSDVEQEILGAPDDPEIRYELGDILGKLGKAKPSAAMMLAALRCDPTHRGAHAALARYYEEIGRNDLAERHRAVLDQEIPPQETPPGDANGTAGQTSSSMVRSPLSVAGVTAE
jgi:Flp pilus assembly protein TadD